MPENLWVIESRYRAALQQVDIASYPVWQTNLKTNLGLALKTLGPHEEAHTALGEAARLIERLDLPKLSRDALVALAEISLAERSPQRALTKVELAGPLIDESAPPPRLHFHPALIECNAHAALGDGGQTAIAPEKARKPLSVHANARFDVRFYQTAANAHGRLGGMNQPYRDATRLRHAERAALMASSDAIVSEIRTRVDVEGKGREHVKRQAQRLGDDSRLLLLGATMMAIGLTLGAALLIVRLRTRHQLHAANALKAAIVDHAMEAIVTVDTQGHIVEFNPAAEAMFGWRRDEAMGQPHEILVPERNRESRRQVRRQLVTDPNAGGYLGRRWTLTAVRADGTEFRVEVVGWRSPFADDALFTMSLRDITEQQRSAELIERQRNELRQSEKLTMMGSLLAGVAHELNNPLAIVMGRASLLEEMGVGTPMQHEAQRVREAAQRCGRIVRTFLNMARQREAVLGEVQINDVVRGAAEMLGYALRTNAIRLELRLAANLPVVQADSDQLGQVVLNLMVNAQQAMMAAQGPRQLLVETGCEVAQPPATTRVWLRVADSGPGVPTDLRERIFAPFFTTKPEGMGTGLGLSVSSSIARAHGGELALEDTASGASFLFWLPQTTVSAQSSRPEGIVETSTTDGAKVLVVDDEPELADMMRAMLETAGFEAVTAESGAVALELLELSRFDVLVSDIRMPDIDGATLWHWVKERDATLAQRMLFVTGDTLSLDVRQFLAESGCSALDKPFSNADLVDKVMQLRDA